jgi:hypothetical protein
MNAELAYYLEKSKAMFLATSSPANIQECLNVHSKLWKLQQKDRSGLTRVEIGQIASRIAQLYYQYYLATSETNYLQESFAFYNAIRSRNYFLEAPLDYRLRFLARFIIVCLLLSNNLLPVLIAELELIAHSPTYTSVLQQIKSFAQAIDPISHRINHQYVLNGTFSYKEAILIGNHLNQIKYAELTIDMYRMVQSLERCPVQNSKSHNEKRLNIRKQLLFQPTVAHLLQCLATCQNRAPPNSGILVYISSFGKNGQIGFPKNQVLYPSDLLPFTRVPLIVIVDCNTFCNFDISAHNDFLCLVGPAEYPEIILDQGPVVGSIFTLFLHCPLRAFMAASNISNSKNHLEVANELVKDMERTIHEHLVKARLERSFSLPLQDYFASNLLVRYILCRLILESNVHFSHPKVIIIIIQNWPSCFPSIPENALPNIHNKLLNLAIIFDVQDLYS